MSEISYQDVISQIKDKLDIVDVVSKHVILKKSGGNYWGLCPFHNEKTPSFSVNPSKQIYKCFGCGEGGDALSFLMKINNQSFGEVIKEQAEFFGIPLPSNMQKAQEARGIKQQVLEAMKAASDFYMRNLLLDKTSNGYQYIKNRGFDDSVINRYKLGLAPNSYEALVNALKKDFSMDILEKAGLVIKRESSNGYIDRFKNRLMISIFDEKGNIVAFGARAIEDGQTPKYLNSSETIAYNKSHILYGLYHAKEAIKKDDAVIIMEGYFDVISAQTNGVENCVGACGTALTDSHVKLISRFSPSRRIYLAFDTDSAGQKATERGAQVIKDAFSGLGNIKQFDENYTSMNNDKYACEIRVVVPPDGKDPDEFIKEHGAEEYKNYVKSAPLLLDYQINKILKQKTPDMTPIEKSNIVKQVIPYLDEINNNIIKDEYVKIVSTKLEIDESSLRKELRKSLPQQAKAQVIAAPSVNKTLNISEKAQKNLLSLYLINESIYSIQSLNAILKNIHYTNEKLIIVKDTIDKLSLTVNNVKELIDTLYTAFADNNEIKDLITDLIYLSDSFKGLSEKDFKTVINENIETINTYKLKEEQSHLRSMYKKVNDDELQAIEYQMQLREKIKNKLRTGDN